MHVLRLQKLGELVTLEDLEAGRVYPPVQAIHEVTVKIAAHLAEHLYKTKKAWNYPGTRFSHSHAYSSNVELHRT